MPWVMSRGRGGWSSSHSSNSRGHSARNSRMKTQSQKAGGTVGTQVQKETDWAGMSDKQLLKYLENPEGKEYGKAVIKNAQKEWERRRAAERKEYDQIVRDNAAKLARKRTGGAEGDSDKRKKQKLGHETESGGNKRRRGKKRLTIAPGSELAKQKKPGIKLAGLNVGG